MKTRTKVFYGITVSSAVACFALVVFALATAVDFFSYLFSLTDETYAREYLKNNFSSLLATLYLSIFGMVIVIANTIVLFMKFLSRGKLFWIHIFYYLAILIAGIVALASTTEYEQSMIELANQTCSTFECSLSINYLTYRGHLLVFFICFCLFFPVFALFYQLSIIYEATENSQEEKKDQQAEMKSKEEEGKVVDEVSINNPKNLSFVSDID